MADNYLERKMEEHRSGAPRKSVHKVASLGCRPGMWEVPFAERRVVVAGNGSDLDVMMVEQLRSVGCKVAFMGGGKKMEMSLPVEQEHNFTQQSMTMGKG